jgi:hypothetical protein
MDDYNQQAADFIFRENNAPGRVEADSIDLHGLYVEEAERILEERIRSDQANGQTHLYAIVGKGNHSAGGVQKLKPKVEELCQELGLRYETDEGNTGRIIINLQGGQPVPPSHHGDHGGYPGGQPHHGGQQHHGGQHHHQPEEQNDDLVTIILKKLEKACCTVM